MQRRGLMSAAALLAVVMTTGCTTSHRTAVPPAASVPLSFAPIAPTAAPAVPAASSATTTASPTRSPATGAASPTPCPVDAPQVFVEVTDVIEVTDPADGSSDVVVTYRAAERLCGGNNDGTFVTSGVNYQQAVVDPQADIRMLPPGVSGGYIGLDPVDLPDAISNSSYRYFGLTFSPTGTIIAMLQYYHP